MHYPYSSHAPPPRQTSPLVWVILAVAILAVVGGLGTCAVVGGLVAIGASAGDEASGVVMGPQTSKKILERLHAKRLLAEDETLLAYYDASVSLDMSEVTIITRERVVYAKGDVVAAFALKDVARVTHHKEALIGDVFEITADDARSIRVEVAPLNGGESYFNVLEDAWRKHRPDARIARAPR